MARSTRASELAPIDLHDGTPFWPRRDGLLATYPPLRESRSCEVAVIGGGITGSLISLELARRGIDVVVLDRRDAGGGSTSASTSMLQYEIDTLLVDLADAIGWSDASLAYRECRRGIDLVERATQVVGDLCGFRRSPSVFMALRSRDVAVLRSELDARRDAGFDVTWLDGDQLEGRWGLRGLGAIESVDGASVDPYALCHRALGTVVDLGGHVHDRTEVVRIEHSRRSVELATARGATLRAGHVVVATGYEVDRLLPSLPIALHTSFAVVTEPVEGLDRIYPDGLLFWDHDDPYFYGRTTDDGRMLAGGRDVTYRDARRRRRALPAKTRAIAADLTRRTTRLPEIDVAFAWCGAFAETPDGLAYIGSHSRFPRTHFALGFGGNGITYSALAAQYLADAIGGTGCVDAVRLFGLERPTIAVP